MKRSPASPSRPVDGTPLYKITASGGDALAPAVMRAVVKALDEKG